MQTGPQRRAKEDFSQRSGCKRWVQRYIRDPLGVGRGASLVGMGLASGTKRGGYFRVDTEKMYQVVDGRCSGMLFVGKRNICAGSSYTHLKNVDPVGFPSAFYPLPLNPGYTSLSGPEYV